MSELIYCLKCKVKTLTDNIQTVITKNKRNMITGICTICGVKKNKFIKNIYYIKKNDTKEQKQVYRSK